MKKQYIILIFSFILIGATILSTSIYARPGGGHSSRSSSSSSSRSSYSSHSSHSSSGGSYSGSSSGTGTVGFFVFVAIFIIFQVVGRKAENKSADNNARNIVDGAPTLKILAANNERIGKKLEALRALDPNFSKVLFLDFVSSMYTKIYALQATKDEKNLRPFMSSISFNKMKAAGKGAQFSEIVINNMRIVNVFTTDALRTIIVNISANYTKKMGNKLSRFVVEENLTFSIKATTPTPEPHKMQEFSCPSCGAPSNFTDAGVCNSCGNPIVAGEMNWCVDQMAITRMEQFQVSGLTYYAEETGTTNKTLVDYRLNANAAAFAANHKVEFNQWFGNFASKVIGEYFMKLYAAWSDKDLSKIRHLISDRMHDSWIFWINTYTLSGLTNKLDNVQVTKIVPVKIELDKYYESITVRIYAQCNDYVVDSSGKVRGGSKSRVRKFSEYWTFVRRSGVEKDSYDYSTCPNCGAKADKMGQVGVCEYCDTKISTGVFSWVLAIIAQDEAYTG